MRTRLALALASAVALTGVLSASAATKTPVLDGKKVKKIEFKGTAGIQENDAEFFTGTTAARSKCQPPRCVRTDFLYQPAKGVKGDLYAQVTWTGAEPADVDLMLFDGTTQVAGCGGFMGSKEWIGVKDGVLKPGKTYTLIADFYRSIPSNALTGSLEFPGTIPAEKYSFLNPVEELIGGPGVHPINCTQ